MAIKTNLVRSKAALDSIIILKSYKAHISTKRVLKVLSVYKLAFWRNFSLLRTAV